MKPLLHLLLFALTISLSLAQESRVLVQNAKTTSQSNPVVNVKWYNQQFVYKKGVNVYRREAGTASWIKLNAAPIVMQKSVPPAWLQRDEELEGFLDMAKEMEAAEEDGFVLLSLFGKSFQSADYAKLVGIQYDDNSIDWGKSYEYRVTKIETNGKESELGISSSLRVGNYSQSEAVKEYKVVLEKDIAKMTWKQEEDRFYGVNVYRNSSTDPAWIKVNETPIVQSEADEGPEADVMFQDDSLQVGLTLRYKIAGLDFFGEETVLSEEVKVEVGDFTPPPPPLNPEKKVRILDVTISWTPQQADDLKGFHVYRSTKSDGPFTKMTTTMLAETDTAFFDHVPQPAFYYYYVAAVDEFGNEGKSLTILVEVQDVVPPLAPVHVLAKSDTGKVVLTWAKNKELDIMGYHVYRAISTDTQSKFVLVNADPFRDTTYTQVFAKNASNKFLFKIIAVDTSYNRSESSEVVSARLPDVTAPIKPSIKNITIKGDSIIISWLPNLEADLKGFNLYRFKEGNSKPLVIGPDKIQSTARVFADTVMQAGKYSYQLQAIDESGNSSELSEAFSISKTAVFRFSFGEIEAKYKRGKKAVILSWSGSNSPMVYTVFRKTEGDITWKPVSGMVKTQSYTDKSTAKRMIYVYQIRAYSNSGEVIMSSPKSIKTKK